MPTSLIFLPEKEMAYISRTGWIGFRGTEWRSPQTLRAEPPRNQVCGASRPRAQCSVRCRIRGGGVRGSRPLRRKQCCHGFHTGVRFCFPRPSFQLGLLCAAREMTYFRFQPPQRRPAAGSGGRGVRSRRRACGEQGGDGAGGTCAGL